MKLPLFFKDDKGKWQLVPFQAFEYNNDRWEMTYESFTKLNLEEQQIIHLMNFQAVDLNSDKENTWYVIPKATK